MNAPAPEISATFADRVRHAMEVAGLTKAELARRVGVSKAAVSGWVHGNIRNMRHEHLARLAEVTGFSERWLISGRGAPRQSLPRYSPERFELLRLCEGIAEYEVSTAIKILRGLDKQ